METSNFNENTNPSELHISQRSVHYLSETRKWAFFLAIVGFIMIALIVVLGITFASVLASFGGATGTPIPSTMFSIIYILLGILYFFPTYYLYKFAVKTKTALEVKDNNSLEEALKNQKSLYKFMGILMVVVLSIYGLALFGMLLGGAFTLFA